MLIPEVCPENLPPQELEKFKRGVTDDCSAIYRFAQENPDAKFVPYKIRPTKVSISAILITV